MTDTREHTIRSLDGTQIGAVTVGSGQPLVMVHGAWNWRDHWMGVAEELAQSRTCWVMDRRARGSSGDGDDYSFDREIEDIESVLDAAGDEASLIGHSSGAIYALEAARRHGVERLAVYEPPLRWAERGDPHQIVDRVRGLVDEGKPDEGAEMFFREEGRLGEEELCQLKTLPVWEEIVALAPICVREWDAILDANLSVDRYQDLSMPTLVLAGSENLDHPSMATESLSATLPYVRTSVLDGHAHRAHLTDPKLVADEVGSFLEDGVG